jgi:hypothetical protein
MVSLEDKGLTAEVVLALLDSVEDTVAFFVIGAPGGGFSGELLGQEKNGFELAVAHLEEYCPDPDIRSVGAENPLEVVIRVEKSTCLGDE